VADIHRLKAQLISDEAIRLKPYYCTANKLTIGIGRNLEDVGISEAEAHFLFENDVARVERQVQRDPDISGIYMRLDERRQEAILNMCFQLGLAGLKRFRRMWAALAMRDYERAYIEALDSNWAKQTPNRANRVANILRGNA
jgi:lysozyme